MNLQRFFRNFFLDDERKDFLGIVRRTAQYSGVQLLGWCVMGNHFHLLAFLPAPRFVDEQEVIERYGALNGVQAASSIASMFIEWRKQGETGERRVSERLSVGDRISTPTVKNRPSALVGECHASPESSPALP